MTQLEDAADVVTLNIFFCFVPFLYKIMDLPGGQINEPFSGKYYSLPFLPATPSSLSRTLKGLFELTQCPLRLGAEVPGQTSKTTVANLDCAYVENALFYMHP